MYYYLNSINYVDLSLNQQIYGFDYEYNRVIIYVN